mgnify:CR=1 FL=1
MHELAVAQNIIAIIEAEEKKQGFKRVLSISLRIGELSGVIPECLLEFFPMAARGTAAEGAALISVRCLSCGAEGRPEKACCSVCGAENIKLISGREFFVESIEVE